MGEQIKLASLRRNISMEIVAERSVLGRTTVRAIEKGRLIYNGPRSGNGGILPNQTSRCQEQYPISFLAYCKSPGAVLRGFFHHTHRLFCSCIASSTIFRAPAAAFHHFPIVSG